MSGAVEHIRQVLGTNPKVQRGIVAEPERQCWEDGPVAIKAQEVV
jgi:hypothetical protein